jgi:hypothetical protein
MPRTKIVADAVLLIRISAFAAIVPLLTRLPIRQLEALMEPAHPNHAIDPDLAERIIRYTDLVCRLGRRLIARLCLTRGLTLFYFLRRAGVNASLVFGAGTVRDDFAGHCWLVRNGEPYLEKVDPRTLFTPVYSFRGFHAKGIGSQPAGETRG